MSAHPNGTVGRVARALYAALVKELGMTRNTFEEALPATQGYCIRLAEAALAVIPPYDPERAAEVWQQWREVEKAQEQDP